MKQVHETQPVGEATGDLPADAIVADTYGAGGIPVPFDLILEDDGLRSLPGVALLPGGGDEGRLVAKCLRDVVRLAGKTGQAEDEESFHV
jgi:hypothetical protein